MKKPLLLKISGSLILLCGLLDLAAVTWELIHTSSYSALWAYILLEKKRLYFPICGAVGFLGLLKLCTGLLTFYHPNVRVVSRWSPIVAIFSFMGTILCSYSRLINGSMMILGFLAALLTVTAASEANPETKCLTGGYFGIWMVITGMTSIFFFLKYMNKILHFYADLAISCIPSPTPASVYLDLALLFCAIVFLIITGIAAGFGKRCQGRFHIRKILALLTALLHACSVLRLTSYGNITHWFILGMSVSALYFLVLLITGRKPKPVYAD